MPCQCPDTGAGFRSGVGVPTYSFMEDATSLAEVFARLTDGNRSALRLALSSVGELMAREVVTVHGNESVEQAIGVFVSRRFRHLLVSDGTSLTGVVSDRDVLRFLAQHPDGRNARVSAVMTTRPITIGRDASVADAISLILHNRINCLPVVAKDGAVEGILTTTDLLRALYALQYWLERVAPADGR